MKIDPDSVPSSIESAVREIISAIDGQDRTSIIEATSSIEVHHTVGRFIRNNWSLWDNDSPLKRDAVKTYGIAHADDISGLILEWVYALVRGDSFDPIKCCQGFHDHWKAYGTDSLSAGDWPPFLRDH